MRSVRIINENFDFYQIADTKTTCKHNAVKKNINKINFVKEYLVIVRDCSIRYLEEFSRHLFDNYMHQSRRKKRIQEKPSLLNMENQIDYISFITVQKPPKEVNIHKIKTPQLIFLAKETQLNICCLINRTFSPHEFDQLFLVQFSLVVKNFI